MISSHLRHVCLCTYIFTYNKTQVCLSFRWIFWMTSSTLYCPNDFREKHVINDSFQSLFYFQFFVTRRRTCGFYMNIQMNTERGDWCSELFCGFPTLLQEPEGVPVKLSPASSTFSSLIHSCVETLQRFINCTSLFPSAPSSLNMEVQSIHTAHNTGQSMDRAEMVVGSTLTYKQVGLGSATVKASGIGWWVMLYLALKMYLIVSWQYKLLL